MTLTRYLIIDKKDDVYLKIEADEDIRRELGQFFVVWLYDEVISFLICNKLLLSITLSKR